MRRRSYYNSVTNTQEDLPIPMPAHSVKAVFETTSDNQ